MVLASMRHRLIYIYDALCGWCYGFSPVMQQLHEKYASHLAFEVMSGGMMMGLRAGPIGEVAPYIEKAYPDVERATGVRFGEDFLDKILRPGTAVLSSEMPGIALSVFRKHLPESALQFAHEIQNALYLNGLELNLPENYVLLAEKFGLSGADFVREMQREESRYEALTEFQTVANWGINGYPTVLLKPAHDHQYYMVARGYTPFERLDSVIQKILPDLA
jgi:putative protein-disulfide isomerase